MNVKNVEKENGSAKVTVEIAKDEFQTALDKAYAKIRKDIMIPGFRKGKAPRKFVERMYGSQVFYEDAVSEIFPDIYEAAIIKQELKAVGQPSVTDMQTPEDGSVVLTVSTELYPEVTLGEYKGIEVPKETVSISKAEVDAELSRMQERNARIETVDREAKTGDTVVLDFEGFVDGKPFDGGKADNYELTLGAGQFIPGFEDQVVGHSVGDEFDVNVTFPEDYHAEELKGKPAVFKIKLHEIKAKELPTVDDEFAKDVSEFDTLDEYKQDIEKHLKEQREKAADNDVENQLVEAIIEKVQAEIPDEMVENEVDEIINSFAYRLQSQGLKLETYLKYTGQTTDDLRVQYKPQAERQVKVRLGLEKIAELEGLKPTEEETEAEYQKLADAYGMPLESVKNLVTVEGINGDIQNQKAIDLVKANAVVVEKKAEEEQTEEKKPAKKRASTKKKAEAAEGEEAAEKPKRRSAKKAESAEEKTEG